MYAPLLRYGGGGGGGGGLVHLLPRAHCSPYIQHLLQQTQAACIPRKDRQWAFAKDSRSKNTRREFNNFYHSLFSTHQHKRCVC